MTPEEACAIVDGWDCTNPDHVVARTLRQALAERDAEFSRGAQQERDRREQEIAALFDTTTTDQPSALALEFAHDIRWPNDRIDIARFCNAWMNHGAQQMRERAAQVADHHPDHRDCKSGDFDDPEILRGCCEVIAGMIRALSPAEKEPT